MGAMAVELETRLEVQIANARAAWAETAEILALTSRLCMPAAAYTYMSFAIMPTIAKGRQWLF